MLSMQRLHIAQINLKLFRRSAVCPPMEKEKPRPTEQVSVILAGPISCYLALKLAVASSVPHWMVRVPPPPTLLRVRVTISMG